MSYDPEERCIGIRDVASGYMLAGAVMVGMFAYCGHSVIAEIGSPAAAHELGTVENRYTSKQDCENERLSAVAAQSVSSETIS